MGVSDGVVAAVGSTSEVGAESVPILTSAGIPIIGPVAASTAELTSPLSFPMTNTFMLYEGGVTMAKAAGATGLHIVTLDVPTATEIVGPLQQYASSIGLANKGETLVPTSATDFSSYAASAQSAGGAVMIILGADQTPEFLNALQQQGVNFSKSIVETAGPSLPPNALSHVTGGGKGVYIFDWCWPVTDTANAGVRQYLNQLKAISKNAPHNASGSGVNAWVAVHVTANLLKKVPAITSAALTTAVKSSGLISYAPMAPFDWSQKAVSTGLLSELNTYSDLFMPEQIRHGAYVPLTNNFVTFNKPFKITHP